ncbi:MAG: UTP--glucose-1-phosphate uridylyltransferase, partial [Candidatus Dadabacteria bacterium]
MLPWSRAVPKELLPVGTLPVFHYVLAEAAHAGIETVVLVNAIWKRALERYLEPDRALEAELQARGRLELLDSVRELARRIELVTTFQHEPLGLGHAVHCAAPVVGT